MHEGLFESTIDNLMITDGCGYNQAYLWVLEEYGPPLPYVLSAVMVGAAVETADSGAQPAAVLAAEEARLDAKAEDLADKRGGSYTDAMLQLTGFDNAASAAQWALSHS